MRRIAITSAALAVGLSVTLGAGQAAASTGTVTVFSTEFQQVNTWENPSGCHLLPLGAHVLINQTDQPVSIYADPFCATPSLTVQPGYGSHVPPQVGSFSA